MFGKRVTQVQSLIQNLWGKKLYGLKRVYSIV